MRETTLRWPEPGGARRYLGLALLVLAVTLPGLADPPLDGHEVLVAQSVQEMHARGDWIVPYFNGEPRLAKPPLNYWLTAAAAHANAGPGVVRPWHARAPSVAAAVGVVLLTASMGTQLFGRRTGTNAALLLCASAGLFGYARDARPDMLYAFWCTAALAAFVAGWRARHDAARRLAPAGMWAAFGLATLTKGPQLPAMLLGACAVWLCSQPLSWRRRCALLRPAVGLALAAAIAVPWWIAVDQRLPEGLLGASQIHGDLLRPHWRALLDPYYLYRPLQLLAPWLALVPLALWVLARRHRRPQVLLLAALVLVPVLALSSGSQKRWFYLLPVLAPLALALALGARRLEALAARRRQWRWVQLFWPAHLLLIGACAAWLTGRQPQHAGAWLALAVSGACIAYANRLRHSAPARARMRTELRLATVAAAAVFAALGTTTLPWSTDRYDKAALAAAAARVPAQVPLLAWSVNPNVYVYYTGRRIATVKSAAELQRRLEASTDGVAALITFEQRLAQLGAMAEVEVLDRTAYSRSRALVLARLATKTPIE